MRRAPVFVVATATVAALILAWTWSSRAPGPPAGEGAARRATVGPDGGFSLAPATVNDVTGLNSTPVRGVVTPTSEAELVALVQEARRKGLKIAIAGKRHSQGGQTSYPGGMVVDMTRFNRIRRVDVAGKRITVESGATWEDVQNEIHRVGLAVEVQQSSNIFTVGGSIGVNAHGRDPNHGPIIETVQALRLLRADGTIVNASRVENPELFSLVVGGYGLFGIILDVDLELTEDSVLEKRTVAMSYRDYPAFFARTVRGHPEVELHYARPSIAPRDLLAPMTVTSMVRTTARPRNVFQLREESGIERNRWFLKLSRDSAWGKDLRWFMQEAVVDRPGATTVLSRNNSMRPEVKFLEYRSATDADILQEYFIPPGSFVPFMDGLRAIVRQHRVNLLSATVRWVRRDETSFLRYAREDCFGVVLYLNHGKAPEDVQRALEWTRALVELTLELGGVYYLPYQRYPSGEQIRRAYPMLDAFFARKLALDPEERFSSAFFEAYRR